jgi:hypothetical protein
MAAPPATGLRVVRRELVDRVLAAPNLVCHTLPAAELVELRRLAALQQVSVNDLIIQALFRTLQNWNPERWNHRSSDWLRILLPTSLRDRRHAAMPAANRMGYAFLTRSCSEVKDVDALLPSLHREMAKIRQEALPERFLSKIGILNAIPGALSWVLGQPQSYATAVLSNVGDPSRRFQARFRRDQGKIVAGNLQLVGFSAMTPIRRQTRASLFVNSYGNQLTITVHLDPRYFDPANTSLFLEQLIHNLSPRSGTTVLRIAA